MKEIIEQFFILALLLNKGNFTETQKQTKWIGNKPATEESILEAEKKLGMKLPEDYKNFLRITDGLEDISATTSVKFLSVNEINFLNKLDDDIVDIWSENDKQYGRILANSILIGGLDQEQQVLLVPPNKKNKNWQCWLFASWIPGEQQFNSFTDYLSSEISQLKNEVGNSKEPLPKPIIDYSLRDALYARDWNNVYKISEHFLEENKNYPYFGGIGNLYSLMLLASYKLNIQKDYLIFLNSKLGKEKLPNERFLNLHKKSAENNKAFIPDEVYEYYFVPQNTPTTLEEIEQIIKKYRKELLKPKNVDEKMSFQLGHLFSGGNIKDFIKIYEQANYERLFPREHLKAALVYQYLKDSVKAKQAIQTYQNGFFGEVEAFAPYLFENLLNIIEQNP
jgi:hypothetical protein